MVGHTHPLEKAGFLSRLFFLWQYTTLRHFRRNKQGHLESNLEVPKSENLNTHYGRLSKEWQRQLKTSNPYFLHALIRCFGSDFMRSGLPLLLGMGCHIALAALVAELIEFMLDESMELWYGIVLALVYIAVLIISSLSFSHFYELGLFVGGRIKASGVMLMFEKCMKFSYIALNKGSGVGKLLNLTAADLEIYEFCFIVHYLWTTPIFFIGIAIFLVYRIGWVGLISLAILIVYVTLLTYTGTLVNKLRMREAGFSDERLKLINNSMDGIRIIKLYGWEEAFIQLVTGFRGKEVGKIRQRFSIRVLSNTLYYSGAAVNILIVLSINKAMGGGIKLSDAFAMISILFSAYFYGVLIVSFTMEIGNTYLAGAKRITQVLMLDDKILPIKPETKQDKSVVVSDASFSWESPSINTQSNDTNRNLISPTKDSVDSTLRNLNFKVRPGKLLVVVGSVGSGKTSLLLGLMNEIFHTEGDFSVGGSVAYVEQEPWIPSMTVQQNILMDSEFVEEKYEAVLRCCSLEDDMEQLTHGDKTMVGEKGLNLSGGQKARIALARAVYANRDIYLLDDPLSAVDASVCDTLFHDCIDGYLKDKTRILVTHQLHVLPHADRILVLNQGRQVFYGKYKGVKENEECKEILGELIAQEEKERKKKKKQTKNKEKADKTSDVKTIVQEEKAIGSIPMKLYYRYLLLGWKYDILFFIFIIFCLGVQLNYVEVQLWIGYWSAQSEDEAEKQYYIDIFGIITGLLIFGILIRNTGLYQGLLTSSQKLHNLAYGSLLRTSIAFYDSNPTGRMINRLSRDVMMVDTMLTQMIPDSIGLSLMMISVFIFLIIIMPINLATFTVYAVYVVFVIKVTVPTLRDIRRHELATKAPIFTTLTTSIAGLIDIRCFKWTGFFEAEMEKVIKDNQIAFVNYLAVSRTYTHSIDVFTVLILGFNAILLVLMREWIEKDTAVLSLAMTSSVASAITWLCKTLVDTENMMTSTQRLFEYTELAKEPNYDGGLQIQITHGEIEFQNVWMRYRDHLDYVLKGISIKIEPGKKVGVVGRTGAGKSSILQVLFRLYPHQQGQILIDGQDLSTVDLRSLRKQLSIIPQTPFVFAASLKKNLDPLDEYDDDHIWRVLESSKLGQIFGNDKSALTTSTNMTQLSVGQKQLLCLARAILRNNKILLMDEATANVDKLTDDLIQKKIRENFSSCTVITIAHRIHTVIDNDYILVMENGTIQEYDSPKNLLTDPNSHLSYLVSFLGKNEAQQLRDRLEL